MVDAAYKLTDEEMNLCQQHLGKNIIFDPNYKQQVHLQQSEAQTRSQLVSEIEYDFQLALNVGNYYLGKAVVNFYLHKLPEGRQLFLDLNCIAITDFCVNDALVSTQNCFEKHRLYLESPCIQQGWNTVQLRYLNAYN
jgi:hypothetical protein